MSDKPAPILQSLFNKSCRICGSDRAHFGFTIHKVDTWFCSAHRVDGQALARSIAVRSGEPGQSGETPDRSR